jgi:UDP-GlcNAc:undecaprenyl-phosphate GlcNAc-1-phosphate transferase
VPPGLGFDWRQVMSPGELGYILLALLVAAVVAFLLTPVAIRIATRAGAIDMPDEGRRVHRKPIPRGGGLAVVASFLVVGSLFWWFADSEGIYANWPQVTLPGEAFDPQQVVGLMGGVALAAAFGFIDDKWQLRARWQLIEQLVLALTALLGGIVITVIYNPFAVFGGLQQIDLPPDIASFVTVLWIVGMINSINFIDGLDGLSTGVSLIAAVTLGVISVTGRPADVEPLVALLCAALAGALAGFLPWNFHPAKVFIGTTGVYSVGFALAVLSIMGTAKVAVALLILGVPIIDTFWIIVRRVSQRKSPFTPDRGHIHHRLLDLGLSHRNAVLVIYALCGGLAVISIYISQLQALYAFLAIVLAGGFVLYLASRRAQEALDARSYPDDEPDTTDGSAA